MSRRFEMWVKAAGALLQHRKISLDRVAGNAEGSHTTEDPSKRRAGSMTLLRTVLKSTISELSVGTRRI